MDFPKSGREFCYEYVKFKYNYVVETTTKEDGTIETKKVNNEEEHVSSIITFGTLKTKNLIMKLGKALSIPLKLRMDMSKRVPDPKMDLTTLKNEPYFAELIKNDENIKKLFEYGVVLENLPVNTSVHAAGVIISHKNLTNFVPLQKVDGTLIIQIDKTECEEVGLLKFDFLGLITLDLEDLTWKYVKESYGIDQYPIPDGDEKTYQLMRDGKTEMCFQIESKGMTKILKDINCSNFEDVNATIALYRPGPMDFIPDYVAGKKNASEVVYPHPIYKEHTESTYGVMIYQEQIMTLVQALAGFSLGKADALRKAISKKKDAIINEMRVDFIKGCKDVNNIDEPLANEIFDRILPFARYGFNRSHSAAYTIISYDTAYLKANYPLPFMAANLTIGNSNRDKEITMLSYAKNNFKLLPPDVKKSRADFSIEKLPDGTEAIRFGLEKIQGVGTPLAKAIEEANIPEYIGNLEEFYNCIEDKSLLKSDSMERIIYSGALDNYLPNRHRQIELNKPTIAAVKAREEYYGTLMDFVPVMTPKVLAYEYPLLEKIDKERKAIGVMLSGHVLDSYHLSGVSTIVDALNTEDTDEIKDVLVFVEDFHEILTKKGSKMAFLKVSDQFAQTTCVIFPKEYEKLEEQLRSSVNKAIVVTANVSLDEGNNEKNLIVHEVKEVTNSSTKNIFILDPKAFTTIRTSLSTCNGISKVFYLSGKQSTPLYEATFCVDFMRAKEILDKAKIPYMIS